MALPDALDRWMSLWAAGPEGNFASSLMQQVNLRAYLRALRESSLPPDLIVGGRSTSQGSARTGIPFTSEWLLRAAAHPFLTALRPQLSLEGNHFEQASYDLWTALGTSRRVPAFWHLFPWPERPLKPAEERQGAHLFRGLLDLLQPARVFVWGEAERAFLARLFPELSVQPLHAGGASWHAEALHLELAFHGLAELQEIDRADVPSELCYVQVLPLRTATEVGVPEAEATRQRGLAAAGVLDDLGRFTFFHPGQTAALATKLRSAERVIGYQCLEVDFEVIRGETRFPRPPTIDLKEELEEAAGRPVSLQEALHPILGETALPSEEGMRQLALASEWPGVARALEQKLRLLARLHERLATQAPPAFLSSLSKIPASSRSDSMDRQPQQDYP